jgi:PKD repeat protein
MLNYNIIKRIFFTIIILLGSKNLIKGQSISTVYPKNNFLTSDSTIFFKWNINSLYNNYQIELSTTSTFNAFNYISPKINANGVSYKFNVFGVYYWRIKAFTSTNDSLISNTNHLELFSPSSISGMQLWLVPDKDITLLGNKITQWGDQSGLNRLVIQTDSSKSPTIIPNFLNGHSVLQFDGINDQLHIQDSLTFKSFFILSAWNGTFSSFPSYNTMISCDNPTARSQLVISRGSTTDLFNGGYYGDSLLINGVYSLNYLPSNQFKITEGYKSVPATYCGTQKLGIGRDNDYDPWKGWIPEIIFYNNTNFNPSFFNKLNNYFYDKYAPPVDLGFDITKNNSFCDTVISAINAFNNQYNYIWSTGATTPTISVNKFGKYWVNATNIFGKVSSDTIIVNFPNYNKPLQNLICLNNSLLWNTQLPKSNYTFQWQDNSVDSLFTVTQAGNYYVKITDSFSCFVTSDTVKITVDNFPSTASLGPDVSLCAGNLITLTSGLAPSLTYTWSDGSHSNSLVINSTGQYSVVVTNTNSCVAKDTINVTIVGQAPIANFSQTTGCKNTAVSFTNLSSAPISNTITSTLWDFGDPLSASNTSTLSNPFHTFSDTGNYTVKLKVITNVGCEQTVLKNIHIAQTPTVNFSNGISCQNDSTQFTSLISSPSYSISNWLWNFGDVISGASNTSSLTNPKHLFSNQTNYTIKLIATNNAGCKDSISKIVNVKAQVKAMFSYSAACTNAVVRFQDNSIVPAPASSTVRNWSFGVSTTSTLVSQYYPLAGVYPVTLTVIGTNGCISYATKQVTVTIPPTCNFVTPQNFCINDSNKLIDASVSASSAIQNWKWTVNTTPYSTLQSPYLHVTDTANHIIKLRVIDGLGCKDSTSKSVYVYPLPIVDFATSPNFIFSQTSATLTPNILTGLAYNWTGTNSFSSSLIAPIYQFADTGSYQITLLLTNNHGCKNSKTKSFIVYNRRTDLAILDITPSIQSDGYLDLTANLANFGTTTITDFKINYKLTNGGQIKENWSGTLNAGIFYDYHFSGSALVNEADKNSIVCVTISQVNGGIDDDIQNNNLCLALFVKDIDIFSPYPNPTNNDVVFPIVLKKDATILFDITNAIGGSVLVNNSIVGNAGLNLIPLSISDLSSGCYIVKITINEKIFIKKIIKY